MSLQRQVVRRLTIIGRIVFSGQAGICDHLLITIVQVDDEGSWSCSTRRLSFVTGQSVATILFAGYNRAGGQRSWSCSTCRWCRQTSGLPCCGRGARLHRCVTPSPSPPKYVVALGRCWNEAACHAVGGGQGCAGEMFHS
eukprot:1012646-Pelagomonas_calceolata.AAC.3